MTQTSLLSQHICQMGLLSLPDNSTFRHNSGPDVAVEPWIQICLFTVVAGNLSLPWQEQFFIISFNQNFHADLITKAPPKLKTLIILNTKINQTTVVCMQVLSFCYTIIVVVFLLWSHVSSYSIWSEVETATKYLSVSYN